MNFKLGFLAGATAGYSLARFLTEAQRRTLEQKLSSASNNERVSRVVGAVRRGAGRAADSVAERVVEAADDAAERADAVLTGDSPDGFGEADRPPTAAEAVAAERAAETAPDVGDAFDDMARRGSDSEGEGRVS